MSKISFRQTHAIIKKWAVPEIFGSGSIASAVRAQSKVARQMFKTPPFCMNPVFAFVYRTKFEKSPTLKFERLFIDCYGGGIVGVDRVTNNVKQSSNDEKPIILLFPGSNETTYSTKVQTLCGTYLNAGYSHVFMCNYRGKCHTPFKTPQLPIPQGKLNDIHVIVDHITDLYPDREILLAGDCWGGQFIVDYFTTKYRKVPDYILGGVIHSVQWNLEKSFELLLTEPNYSLMTKPQAKTMKSLILKGKKGSEGFPQMVKEKLGDKAIEEVSALSLEDPDNYERLYYLFKPLFDGLFNDKEDFLCKTSPSCMIGNVARPLVVINSVDDPTAPLSYEDIEGIEKDPNVCLLLFASGGHCGYVQTMFPNVTNLIDDIVVECSNIVINESKSKSE